MHPIFLGNLSLKCFLQRNKGRVYSLTPTTKSRRLRTARSAAFMQNFERMESSLATIVSLICSQRTDLIYNFPILNFYLINSSCSAAVNKVRNVSGKLFLSLLRREDSPVVLAALLLTTSRGQKNLCTALCFLVGAKKKAVI